VNKFYQKKLTTKNARFQEKSSLNISARVGRKSSVYLNDEFGPPNPAIQTPNIVFINKQVLSTKRSIKYEPREIDDIENQCCDNNDPLWGKSLVNKRQPLGSSAHGLSGEPSQTHEGETLSPIHKNPDTGGLMNFNSEQVIKKPTAQFEKPILAHSDRLNPKGRTLAIQQKSGVTQLVSNTDHRSSVEKISYDRHQIIGMMGSMIHKVGKAEIANRRKN
jgi:hypothetical protein